METNAGGNYRAQPRPAGGGCTTLEFKHSIFERPQKVKDLRARERDTSGLALSLVPFGFSACKSVFVFT